VSDPVGTVFGTNSSGTSGGGFNGAVTSGMQQLEDGKKQQLYSDIMANTHVDDITRNELVNMFSNASSTDISNKLNDALAGKGIYAARLYNQTLKNYANDMPGRAQLTPGMQAAPGGAAAVV
jgi:hypothetical protein